MLQQNAHTRIKSVDMELKVVKVLRQYQFLFSFDRFDGKSPICLFHASPCLQETLLSGAARAG